MALVNYYYGNHVDATGDELLTLCRSCARPLMVTFAQRGDPENECEFCGVSNDEARSRALDAQYTAITGSPAPARRQG